MNAVTYRDDADDSPALALWAERLNSYLDGQEGIEALRSRIQPNPPWPDADNPILGYLIDRAKEIHDDGGLEAALTWLAVHAWFESAIDTPPASSATLGREPGPPRSATARCRRLPVVK